MEIINLIIFIFGLILITDINFKKYILLYFLGLSLIAISMTSFKFFKNNYIQIGGSTNTDEAIKNIASIYNDNNMIIENLEVTNSLNLLPEGIIVAWSSKKIPKGWVICDGKNDTPDLRNKFIYGCDKDDDLGKKGGSTTHTLSIDEMPSHTHKITNIGDDNGDCGGNKDCGFKSTEETSSKGYGVKAPNSIVNIENTGNGKAHDIMPPYYKLYYIMRKN